MMPESGAPTPQVYAEQAMRILSEVRAAGLRDPLVDVALAKLCTKLRPGDALQFAESALGLSNPTGDFTQSSTTPLPGQLRGDALSIRAEALARQGNFSAAS